MRKHVAPDIGDDALADGHDEVVARRTGAGEHRHHRHHHAEIAVDHDDAFGAQAEVDHAAHRDRHHQRGGRRDGQRDEGEESAAAIARHVGRQRQQRAQPGTPRRRLRKLRLDDGFRLHQRVARRRGLAASVFAPVLKLFSYAHPLPTDLASPDRPSVGALANPGQPSSDPARKAVPAACFAGISCVIEPPKSAIPEI